MNIEVLLAICLSLASFIFMTFAIIRLYFVDVDLQAMKKSTHQIQYVDPEWGQTENEIKKVLDQSSTDFEGIP
jgi:hypothetical protein